MATTTMKEPLEKDIQRLICDWLSYKGFFFWRNNTIPVYSEGKFRALPKYTPRGLPDIIVLNKGIFIGIEVKRPSERGGNPKTQEAQENMKNKIEGNGGIYFIAHHLDEVIERMKNI